MRASESLVALGLTWREASSAARAPRAAPVDAATWEGLRAQGATGLVELHTCARSLWILSTAHERWVGGLLQARLSARLDGGLRPFVLAGDDAARYTLRVAVGLDSYAQGEADVGHQLAAAFVAARSVGRTSRVLHEVEQAAARLVAEGRERGFVRATRGLGALAVQRLRATSVDLGRPVAVVGAGAIGVRVVHALRRADAVDPIVYNRSPRAGTVDLGALPDAVHEAVVLCTAAPRPWYAPRGDVRVIIDLGQPRQTDAPGAFGLDALLAGEGHTLAPSRLAAAEEAVDAEIDVLMSRMRGSRVYRKVGGLLALRDTFLDGELDARLAEALEGVGDEQARRVRAAARGALRAWGHRVVTWMKHELAESEPAEDA